MARSIKKVRKPKTAKFWIILSSIIVVAIAAIIIGSLVGYSLSNTAKLNRRFAEYTSVKLNHNELETKLKDKNSNYKEIFVFAYDSNFKFDEPDKKVDRSSKEYQTYLQYQEVTKELANVKKLVDKSNEITRENQLKTGFFVIDASLESNYNILGNDEYSSLSNPALITFYVGKLNESTTYDSLTFVKPTETIEVGNEKYTNMSGGNNAEDTLTTLKNIEINLIKTYNVTID